MSLQQAKDSLKSVLGVVILILVLTYCAVLMVCVYNWNTEGVAMFGTGFALFAQGVLNKFVEAELKAHTGGDASITVSGDVKV